MRLILSGFLLSFGMNGSTELIAAAELRLPEARVARRLARLLAQSEPGAALPTVRAIRQACRVGPQTVQAVTHRLQQQGILAVRPQAGLFRTDVDGPGLALNVQVISFEPGGIQRPHYRAALLSRLQAILGEQEIDNAEHVLPYSATTKDVERIVKRLPGACFLLVGLPHIGLLAVLDVNFLPYVNLIPACADLPGRWVASDPLAATEAQLQHLLGFGHRRIGYLHNISPGCVHRDFLYRREAFYQLLAENSLPCRRHWVAFAGYDEPRIRAAARAVLQGDPAPTALICSDHHAAGVYDIAAELGLRVPRDLSVVGTDGLPAAETVTPKLTTLLLSRDRLARLALDSLLAQHHGNQVPDRLTLKTELIVRDSSGAAPATGSP